MHLSAMGHRVWEKFGFFIDESFEQKELREKLVPTICDFMSFPLPTNSVLQEKTISPIGANLINLSKIPEFPTF